MKSMQTELCPELALYMILNNELLLLLRYIINVDSSSKCNLARWSADVNTLLDITIKTYRRYSTILINLLHFSIELFVLVTFIGEWLVS